MLIKRILSCFFILLICCSCNLESIIDGSINVSDDFYYKYVKNNNEITISLTKKNGYIKSSFDELCDLYSKYGVINIVTFEKGKEKFYPNSLTNAFQNKDLTKINGFENIDTSYVVDFSGCFAYCNCVDKYIVDSLKFNNAADCSGMFSHCNSIYEFDSSNYNFSNTYIIDNMFFGCDNLLKVDFSYSNFSNVTSMYSIFSQCRSLESIDFTNSDFSNCTIIAFAFEQCSSLKEIYFNNSSFHNLANMSGMFHLCKSLNTVDLSNLDLANVESCVFYSTPDPYDEEDYVGMFRYCSNLKNVYFPISFDVRLINNPYTFAYCNLLEAVYYKDGDNIEYIYLTKEY